MPQTLVLLPLLNANEPEARLVQFHVADGQPVQKGDLLLTIETTKAASDVEAPQAGFVRLAAREGEMLAVGAVLAYITATADEPLESAARPQELEPASPAPTDLRITKPARILAEQLGLDLATLPVDRLITEAVLRELATAPRRIDLPAYAETSLILYGAGGHAKAVLEMARATGAFQLAGIVDDNPTLTGASVLGVPVLGTREILPQLMEHGVRLAANGVGGIINIEIRVKLFELLASVGLALPVLCHPRATVEPSAQIEAGVQVFANAYVGSAAVLHENCMINTGAIVSHDCEIGRYTHIAPGCLLAGHVHVGERALVGMGVTTMIGLQIGSGARIGNGAVLLADVPERQIVPAGKIWLGPEK